MIGLVLRGLRHHWRTSIGVMLGATCAAAVLVGALAVGDSVRISLREQALRRIGRADAVLLTMERFFPAGLADRLDATEPVAPVLHLQGIARDPGNVAARAGIVNVYGVDTEFFGYSVTGRRRAPPQPGKVFLNERLARQLALDVGATVLLRIDKPGFMPRDMVMTTVEEIAVARRVEVEAILTEAEFGRFGLRASQVPPFNVFVALSWLQAAVELPDRANMLLARSDAPPAELCRELDATLRQVLTLADVGLKTRVLPGQDRFELTSDRVFLGAPVVAAAASLRTELVGLLTYFVTELRKGERRTPYSMVGAVGPLGGSARTAPELEVVRSLRGSDVRDPERDGIVLNRWCADDLQAEVGDRVRIEYFVMGAGLQLQKSDHEFTVRGIVPLRGVAADPTWMPQFPGLSDSENCRDWEPGVPVDLEGIRDVDEKYWDDHRGTPKAFIALDVGERLWANRYGRLTAIRGPASAAERVGAELLQRLEPADLGLFFQDVRTRTLAGGTSATDFGGLFIGLSFFLIGAALLLTALLFAFGVEARSAEIGTLLAVGFKQRVVRRLFLIEALGLASLGAVLGAFVGLYYTEAVLYGLGTLWRDAVGTTDLRLHVRPVTVLGGGVGSIVVAMLAIWWAMRRTFRAPAVVLLGARAGVSGEPAAARRSSRVSLALAALATTGAVALALVAGTSAEQMAGAFFGAGALLLVAGLLVCRWIITGLAGARGPGPDRDGGALGSVMGLGLRNIGRRPGRSVATVAFLAGGTFLVVAVQANRLEPPRDASRRDSGTGGFALFGRTTLPILRDLTTSEGREAYGLDAEELSGAGIVPLRVREGDDASCLNLSLAQNPRLVGVQPQALASRRAFVFAEQLEDTPDPWLLLERDLGPGVVPAIGDAASVTWALHKSVGDDLDYRDEQGRPFRVRIVGTVQNSILQGNLLVAEQHLQSRFPSASGHRMLLVEAEASRVAGIESSLNRALADLGLEMTDTGARLAAFHAVQNTYLMIFQVLGGLGLLLGSIGVGLVVLRNVLERRGELAVLGAVGFKRSTVRSMLLVEHGVLLALGVGCGVLAALLAVLPAGGPMSTGPMAGLVLGVLVSGGSFVALAAAFSVRGPLLDALRAE